MGPLLSAITKVLWPIAVPWWVLLWVLCMPRSVAAQPSDRTPSASASSANSGLAAQAAVDAEIARLEKVIAEREGQSAALMSRDCEAACVAWDVMRRAAERICALAPGERCEEARARVERSRRNLQRACPQCTAAHEGRQQPANADEGGTAKVAESPAPSGSRLLNPAKDAKAESEGEGEAHDKQTVAPAAYPESSRGGCAACTVAASTTPAHHAPMSLVWLLVASLAAARRLRSTLVALLRFWCR